jgi:hypothetical protein
MAQQATAVEETAIQPIIHERSAEKLPTQNSGEKFGIQMVVDNFQELRDIVSGASDLEKLHTLPINIATQYFDFELNKPKRFVFMGFSEMTSNETGETMDAIILMDKDSNIYENAGAILVSVFLEKGITRGQQVEIAWIGEKKTQKGFRVRLWSVKPLVAK